MSTLNDPAAGFLKWINNAADRYGGTSSMQLSQYSRVMKAAAGYGANIFRKAATGDKQGMVGDLLNAAEAIAAMRKKLPMIGTSGKYFKDKHQESIITQKNAIKAEILAWANNPNATAESGKTGFMLMLQNLGLGGKLPS